MARCGIDLGTTFSAVSWYDENNRRIVTMDLNCSDGERMLRSAVYYPDGGRQPVVGKYALNARKHFPDRVAVGIKRAMGNPSYRFGPVDGKEYTPQDVSKAILKALVREATQCIGEIVTDLVVTVPAYFQEAQKNATMEAAVMAMLDKPMDQIAPDELEEAKKHICLLPEPQAAALAYALAHAAGMADRPMVVYDLGGGTFDVVLVSGKLVNVPGQDDKRRLQIDTLALNGNSNLGGLNWDEEMAKLVDGKIQQQGHPSPRNDPQDDAVLLENSEVGKRTLSFTSHAFVVADRTLHQAEVSQAEFEDATRALIQETRDLLRVVLDEAESKHGIPRDQIDVLLSGGSTRMPMCEAAIREETGKAPLRWDNPDYLVSMGAGYWAFLHGGGEIPVRMGDREVRLVVGGGDTDGELGKQKTHYSVGVVVTDRQGNRANEVVLPVGSAMGPEGDVEKAFYKTEDDMEEVLIVLMRSSQDTRNLADCTKMAEFKIGPLPPGGRAGDRVRVKLGHTTDGILCGEAEDVSTGQKVPIKVDRSMIEQVA
jgi:molecular chaperone DnaK